MKRNIFFWHGESKALREKLLDMSEMTEDKRGNIYYTGYLDDFEAMYKGKFMVLADGTICVTQFGNFGQR